MRLQVQGLWFIPTLSPKQNVITIKSLREIS